MTVSDKYGRALDSTCFPLGAWVEASAQSQPRSCVVPGQKRGDNGWLDPLPQRLLPLVLGEEPVGQLNPPDRVSQPVHGVHAVRPRKRRKRPPDALKAIRWVQAISGARAILLAIAIVALLFLAFLAAGPVVNINHLSVTF